MVTIYHNPRCSKSRKALELLRERGITPRVVHYLDNPPGVQTLREITSLLGCSIGQLVRRGEQAFRDLGLDAGSATDEDLFQAVSENPVLLERPVVINGDRAVIGRPPENILQIIP